MWNVPIVEDRILTIASDTAVGNHRRSPRRNRAPEIAVLPGFCRKGMQIVRAERKMKDE